MLLIFKVTQSMDMFLQIEHGTSSTSHPSSRSKLFQGVTKGNGVDPVLWIIIYIILVRHFYLKGLSTTQFSPTSNLVFTRIVLKCVDEMDLNVLNIEGKHTLEVIDLDQRMLDAWKFSLHNPEVI